MKLKLNISPCPNDTFMFDALVNGRIDTQGIELYVAMLDIEQLNNRLLGGDALPDASKMSTALLPRILDRYRPIDSGSAFGCGTGPLLIAKQAYAPEELAGQRVAIPGEYTTANMMLSRLFPQVTDKIPMLFSDIIGAVESGAADAGVLIHESRFLVPEKGLYVLADLGELWDRQTSLPLPLGVIVVSRSLPEDVRQTFGSLVRESIEYAMAHPGISREFVKAHARELDDHVIDRHIAMFVNELSVSLGQTGRQAMCTLLDMNENALFA